MVWRWGFRAAKGVATAAAAVVLAWLLMTGAARAAEWGTIVPGKSSMEAVRARFGAATRTTTERIQGYETTRWVYEGAGAPAGITRMVVEFGLLTPAGYRSQVVRSLRLEPKPGIFTRGMVLLGWGPPTRFTPEGQLPPALFYDVGLVVTFDKDGEQAESLLFTPPQPQTTGPAEPRP